MIDIPCVIFAGGKSSRMGEDKALLPFGGFSTLTEFQFNRLGKLFKNVYISCKMQNKFHFNATFIEDIPTTDVYAPTLGFLAMYKYLESEKVFVISVDTPFIKEEDIITLIKSDQNDVDATIATLNGNIQPMCGIYHRSLEKHFINMFNNDNHKLGLLLKNSQTTYVNFRDETSFLNLNNPQEYQKALTLV